MKLHDLRPPPGSHTAADPRRPRHRRRQGQDRGPRHEGPEGPRRRLDPAVVRGRPDAAPHPHPEAARLQEPLQDRVRGRERRRIARARRARRARGEATAPAPKKGKAAPITVNQDILRAAGLVRTLDKPLKILGTGELVGAAVRRRRRVHGAATAKIEAAGGTVQVLEVPTEPRRPRRRRRGVDAERHRRPQRRPTRAAADAQAERPAATRADRRRPRPRPPGPPRAEATPPRPRRPRPSRAVADAAERRPSRRQAEASSRRRPRLAAEAAADEPADAPRRRRRRRRGPPTVGRRRRRRRRPATTPSAVFDSLLNAFRAPDIRRRILSSSGCWSSSGSWPTCRCRASTRRSSTQFLAGQRRCSALLDLFSGGGLSTFSVVGAGLNPYINASIIMQLMTGVVPRSRRSAARASTAATRSTSTRAT